MGKKKGRKRGKDARTTGRPTTAAPSLHLSSYTITYDALPTSKRLPPEVVAQQEELHAQLRSDPGGAIPRLERLIKRHPRVPMLYNWLGVAYSRHGEDAKARAIMEENYRRNPDYLFARTNYAALCLDQDQTREIPRIFDHTYDLKMLYPNRDTFHISEVVAFMSVVGRYFARTGELDVARRHSDLLRQLAPEDPLTQALANELLIERLKELLPFKR